MNTEFRGTDGRSRQPRGNSYRHKWIAALSVFLGMAAIVPAAKAVNLSPDNQGEALILPIFTTRSGFDTLISVTNTHTGIPRAMKVRFRDRDGAELASLNVYLERRDTWTAALSESGGGTIINFPDDSCALMNQGGQPEILSALSFPEKEGFVEIFEMGVLVTSPEGISDIRDCERLRTRWTEGKWSIDPDEDLNEPTGTLRASASLINVERGTMYSVVATALAGFSDIPQHTLPGDPAPNLATAHDAGTDAGTTTSRVCDQQDCYEDQWARPIDAVSAALTAFEVTGEFVIEPEIGASTEWVVIVPTRHYYDEEEPLSITRVNIFVVDRQGKGQSHPCFLPTRPWECETSYWFDLFRSLETFSFNHDVLELGSVVPSAILGMPHEVHFPTHEHPLPTAGYARIGLNSPFRSLQSIDGTHYSGVPFVAIVLQEYVNGVLVGQDNVSQRANYSNAFITSRKNRISISQ